MLYLRLLMAPFPQSVSKLSISNFHWLNWMKSKNSSHIMMTCYYYSSARVLNWDNYHYQCVCFYYLVLTQQNLLIPVLNRYCRTSFSFFRGYTVREAYQQNQLLIQRESLLCIRLHPLQYAVIHLKIQVLNIYNLFWSKSQIHHKSNY